jgi:putative PIN family toxin of toxin-antitoxin system
MRLVLDTAVMVAAIRSRNGASNKILRSCFEGHVQMLVSVPLMMEYEAVMSREEHLRASGLAQADIVALLDDVATVLVPVRLAFHWRPNLSDPDDDMVAETSANGGAEVLVTFNVRDFRQGVNFAFEVLTPAATVKKMEMEI